MGRVFGVMGMISSIVMPVSMLVFGPLADIIDIRYLLIVTGILMFAEGLLMLRSKTLIANGV